MDPHTEQLITQVRAYGQNSKPGRLIDAQRGSLRDVQAVESVHVHRTDLPLPADTNLVDVVVRAIQMLGDERKTFRVPKVYSVRAEWIHHDGVEEKMENGIHTQHTSQYPALAGSSPTILYFHGGQFWRMGRAPRWITSRLAAGCGGRCLAVQYGLSPQHPFPTPLIEGLAAYLSLLQPPTGSSHSPIPANEICFAGDSAGGNIAIALTQLILAIRRGNDNTPTRLVWNGEEVEIPLPAGVAVLSPYLDLTRGLDNEGNLQYDIIPARGPPFTNFERCDVWPARPARHHVYADDCDLLHPLVSPVTALDWRGTPPMWICVGEECLADQGIFAAQEMARMGVRVVLEQYAMMPHNFSLIVTEDKSSRRSVENWVSFIKTAISNPTSITPQAIRWSGQTLEKEELDLYKPSSMTLEQVRDMMKAQVLAWGSPPA